MKRLGFWKPLVGSLAVTPFALLAGFLSAGAGHGSYFWTKILFPYTMLSTLISETIAGPFVLLGAIQFPLYGLILALGHKRKSLQCFLVIVLALAHILAAALTFFLIGESFS